MTYPELVQQMERTIHEDEHGLIVVVEPSDEQIEALRFLVSGCVNVRSELP